MVTSSPARPPARATGGHGARAVWGGRVARRPRLAAGPGARGEPQLAGAGYAGPGQGERRELAGLILEGRQAAGHQRRGVAARQPEAVWRPAGPLTLRQRAVRAGAESEDDLGAGVSRGGGIPGLGGG